MANKPKKKYYLGCGEVKPKGSSKIEINLKPKKKTGEISKEVLLALDPTLVTLQVLLNEINSKLKALNNKVDKLTHPLPLGGGPGKTIFREINGQMMTMPEGSQMLAPGVFAIPCSKKEFDK